MSDSTRAKDARDSAGLASLPQVGRDSRVATIVDSLHVLALAAWLACLVSAGVAAVGVFTTLPSIDLELPRFAAYVDATTPPDRRASEFGRIAGGLVMDPVFRGTDLGQAVSAGLAVATLALQLLAFPKRWPLWRATSWLRVLLVIAAASLVAWHAAVVAPRMNEALHAWWSAAAANEHSAAAFRAAFDDDHQRADLLFRLRLVLVLAALALSVCRASDAPRSR
jgi:hypothetical protein